MIAKRLPNYSYEIEKVENYKKALYDKTQTWILHHRYEIEYNLSAQDLKNLNLYYNRPAEELIFLTKKDHYKLHFSKEQTAEHRKRISDAKKGKTFTDEHKRKLSEAHKKKRRHWYHLDDYGIVTAETYSFKKPDGPRNYWISEEQAITYREHYNNIYFKKKKELDKDIQEFLDYCKTH